MKKVVCLNYPASDFQKALETYKENGGSLTIKQLDSFQSLWRKEFIESNFFSEL